MSLPAVQTRRELPQITVFPDGCPQCLERDNYPIRMDAYEKKTTCWYECAKCAWTWMTSWGS